MKIRSGGSEYYMRTDGQTDMKKLIVVFRNFAIVCKNSLYVTKGRYVPAEIQEEE